MKLLIREIKSCEKCIVRNSGMACPEVAGDWNTWFQENRGEGIFPDCPLPDVTANPEETT